MITTSTAAHGVMEGEGSYNKYAKLPAAGSTLAFPLLEKAAQKVRVDEGDEPLVVADYGSSQGKNSLAPIRRAIETLRVRVGARRPILVFHIDQPSNDFNTLFNLLDADPERYTANHANVYPCGIGRSFYENVLPGSSVHLGWCSYAAVWLSRVPGPITGHFIPIYSKGPERAEYTRQAAQDWKSFLSLRATELREDGRLVVVLPGREDDGSTGFENLMHDANSVLEEMVTEGAIRAEERNRMALGTYPRTRNELLAPFQGGGHFDGLILEQCEQFPLPDFAWADYQRDGSSEALARKRVGFFRSVFVPSLALGLDDGASSERCRVFADSVERRLIRRVASHPVPLHSLVQVLVAAKPAAGETS